LTILVVLFLLIRERVTVSMLFIVMLIGWSGGILLLAFTQPFVTVFGYIIAPWFVVLFFIISISIIFVKEGRGERDVGTGPRSRGTGDKRPVPAYQEEVIINEEGNSDCIGCGMFGWAIYEFVGSDDEGDENTSDTEESSDQV